MIKTEKGLNIFDGDENFDVEEYNNENMDLIDALLDSDFVVPTEEDVPLPAEIYNKKVVKIKATNKKKQCFLKTQASYFFENETYTEAPTHTGEGYEHDTTEGKWYKDGIEITVHVVATMPEASNQTYQKYYFCNSELKLGCRIDATYEWVDHVTKRDIDEYRDTYVNVTIPTTDWETKYDANTAIYYTKNINVNGMYEGYTGTAQVDYVRPKPYSVSLNECYKGQFSLITEIESHTGYITVYVSTIPTTEFEIMFYGIKGDADVTYKKKRI